MTLLSNEQGQLMVLPIKHLFLPLFVKVLYFFLVRDKALPAQVFEALL
jgi:hypothetical protein